MHLKKSQQLEIVHYANSQGLTPQLFNIHLLTRKKPFLAGLFGATTPVTVIEIKETNCFFSVNSETNEFDILRIRLEWSPGRDMIAGNYNYRVRISDFQWERLAEWIKAWINYVVEELESAKAWNKLMAIPESIYSGGYTNDPEEYFSEQQRLQLKQGLNNLKHQIHVNFDLGKEDMTLINSKLDELIQKVDQLNRFDFRSSLIGILINIASSILYDGAPLFWSLVNNTLKDFFSENKLLK